MLQLVVFCGAQFRVGSVYWFLSFCVWYFGDGNITLFLHLILQQLADSATVPLNSFVNF